VSGWGSRRLALDKLDVLGHRPRRSPPQQH
jgi:hypothetical protein